MKGITDEIGNASGRRGLFRRQRSTELTGSTPAPLTSDADAAVATVDELARRMDALASGQTTASDEHVVLRLQETLEHRAEQLAASLPTEDSTEIPADISDIDLRLDAALEPAGRVTSPTSMVPADLVPSSASVTPVQPAPVADAMPALAPTPVPAPKLEAAPAPRVEPTAGQSSAAAQIGIDVERIVQLIEDEAGSIQQRIQVEMRGAELRAAEILGQAERDAERIREHGQTQARVLLSEVEEIISEAQQTGEQILQRANEEASSLRADAASMLQQSQNEARTIIEHARSEGEQVLAEQRRLATVRAQEAMREQDRLKDQIRRLEERRRQVLESLEPLINQLSHLMPGEQHPGSTLG